MKSFLILIIIVSLVSYIYPRQEVDISEKITTVKYLAKILSFENGLDLVYFDGSSLEIAYDDSSLSKTRITFLVLNILYSDHTITDYVKNLSYGDEFKRTLSTIDLLVCDEIIKIDDFDEAFDKVSNFKPFTREYMNKVIDHFCELQF